MMLLAIHLIGAIVITMTVTIIGSLAICDFIDSIDDKKKRRK